MKRRIAITLLCLCFCGAVTQLVATEPRGNRTRNGCTIRYIDAVKKLTIHGDTVGAKNSFRRLVQRHPEHAPSWFHLALLYAFDDDTRSINMAHRAYELDTLNKWYAELYGTLLLHTEQFDKALPVLERLVRLDPQNADNRRMASLLWGYRGDASYMKKEMQATFDAYDRALELNPDNSYVLNNYAYFLTEHPGDNTEKTLQKAFGFATRALELNPNNPTILDTYGWVLYHLGRLPEARAALQQAVSFDRTENPEIMYHYGTVLSALGEEFMAEVYLKKALDKDSVQPASSSKKTIFKGDTAKSSAKP